MVLDAARADEADEGCFEQVQIHAEALFLCHGLPFAPGAAARRFVWNRTGMMAAERSAGRADRLPACPQVRRAVSRLPRSDSDGRRRSKVAPQRAGSASAGWIAGSTVKALRWFARSVGGRRATGLCYGLGAVSGATFDFSVIDGALGHRRWVAARRSSNWDQMRLFVPHKTTSPLFFCARPGS